MTPANLHFARRQIKRARLQNKVVKVGMSEHIMIICSKS